MTKPVTSWTDAETSPDNEAVVRKTEGSITRTTESGVTRVLEDNVYTPKAVTDWDDADS